MALCHYPSRRPLLKTPRNWFDKPELLTCNNSNSNFINQNWLTRPLTTISYGLEISEDEFPYLQSSSLQNTIVAAQKPYFHPSQHSSRPLFNSETYVKETRGRQRNNIQLGDFLPPTLQSTSTSHSTPRLQTTVQSASRSHPRQSTSVHRTTRLPSTLYRTFSSTNRDFPVVTQNIFRMGQLTHHLKNWEQLPTSISNRIDDLIQDIKPPLAKELLSTQLQEHAKVFSKNIKETINLHLNSELSQVTTVLNNLNPSDVEEASKIAVIRLKTRLGHRFYRHSLNFSTFENEVGKNHNINVVTVASNNRESNSEGISNNDVITKVSDRNLNINISTSPAVLTNTSNTVSGLDAITLLDPVEYTSTILTNNNNSNTLVATEDYATETTNIVHTVTLASNAAHLSDAISHATSNTTAYEKGDPSSDFSNVAISGANTLELSFLGAALVLPVSSSESTEIQSNSIFNIPTFNKFELLSEPTIDGNELTIPDSQPDSCALDIPRLKRQRTNYSPEIINSPKRRNNKSNHDANSKGKEFTPSEILQSSANCTRLNASNDNSLPLAAFSLDPSDELVINNPTEETSSAIEPVLSDTAAIILPSTILTQAPIDNTIADTSIAIKNCERLPIKPDADDNSVPDSETNFTETSKTIINSLHLINNDYLNENHNSSTASNNSVNNITAGDNSEINYDTDADNLIQSFPSPVNNNRLEDNLIQSFSSTEETDVSTIEQGDFYLHPDKKQAHLKIQSATKVLVIGDSNLRLIENEKLKGRIPKNWSINCIPGANLGIINKLLLELPKRTPNLTDIIIAAGMCDNSNTSPLLSTTLKTAISLKKRIHFQGIIINDKCLNDNQVKTLTKINNNAKLHPNVLYIKPLKTFSTTEDGIHYLSDTVEKLFFTMKMHIQHSRSLN